MTEPIRTLVYVGVAAVVSLLAWVSRPNLQDGEVGVPKAFNQQLFPDFLDPLTARSMEIVQFNEDSAELQAFKVAQESGRWVIPSHGDYPADAENQLRDAATSLVGLEIVDVASDLASEHAMYGVLEPDKAKLRVGDEGVGTLVGMQDAKGQDLVRLIVGKEVDGSPGLRFVRKPEQERVYITKIDLAKLPTDFEKWIEKDLLKINTFDISKVTLKDYSVLPSQGGQFVYSPRMEAAVSWNNEGSSWELDKLTLHSREGAHDASLADTEELNKQKLDDLKTALDDLKIVDVVRKPEGLGSSLKAGAELLQNQDDLKTLVAFGFLPVPADDNKVDIYASNGEVAVDMKDGVQYVLRFGNVEGAEKGTTSKKPGDTDEVKLNRYLFVTAQLSPTLQPPMLEPEPAGPESTPAGDKPAEESKSGGGGGADPADEANAKQDETPPAAQATDKPATDKPATDKPTETPPPKKDPEAEERERIRLENQRKMNDYSDKKKKAQARVAELNARFADWYYVIAEDVYKKIHLSRTDIVQEGATAKDQGFNIDAFRKLETEGLKPPSPATPAMP
jgi:hypothetical protein